MLFIVRHVPERGLGRARDLEPAEFPEVKDLGLDTEGVEPSNHPLGFVNAFREDVVTGSLDRDEVLSMAPEARDGYFAAPPAMGQE